MRIKKLISAVFSAALAISMFSTAVAAEGAEYSVTTADEYTQALASIAASGDTDATILLKTDLGSNFLRTPATDDEKTSVGGSSLENVYIIGVVGKHITLKSDGDTPHSVTLNNCYLVGDVTFDNVTVSGSTIYANGSTLEFTENASGGVTDSIFGGNDRRSVENTHIILNGGTFGNGHPAVMIYGGGKGGDPANGYSGTSITIDGNPGMPGYTPPSFTPGLGDVNGNVTIEIGKVEFKNGEGAVIGGGNNANVGGNVSITVDSQADLNHNFEFITGAGRSDYDGYGHVKGDVTIHANSGMVQYIFGTGWPGAAEKADIEAGKRCSVGGNVTITAGTADGPLMQIQGFSSTASIIGCGNDATSGDVSDTAGASVGGDIKITLENSSYFYKASDSARNSSLTAVAINSICYGTVTIINNGAAYENRLNLYACYQGGKILNQAGSNNAAVIEQNDGYLKYIQTVGSFGMAYPAEINGDVYIKVTGGETGSVYGRQGENELKINGDFNVLVTGGELGYVFGTTVGREMTAGHTSNLTFDGYADVSWLYYLGYLDNVQLINGSTVRLTGSSSNEPFYSRTVKNLTVDGTSVLGLSKSGSLTGNLTVNGTLALARTDNAEDATQPGTIATLSADGTAAGTGKLKPVDASSFKTSLSDSAPVYLEEYVYADTQGSTLALTLDPTADKLFVNRKNHSTNGTDVWFIDSEDTPHIDPTPESKPSATSKPASTAIPYVVPNTADTSAAAIN